jgi:hypothetical protein
MTVLDKSHQGGYRTGREVEGMEGKLNENYLSLIPGLYLEDRMN